MTDTVSSHRTRLRFFALLLAIVLALPAAAASAQISSAGPDKILSTKYFKIFYPPSEDATANWYAGFVDDMDTAVSDLLGSEPVANISLTIYATEADYSRANPMAEYHPGILAHAIPDRGEIGVAVERLRQAPPELARESFRHEMTHVVAGALTNQMLPIGFQEGIAQYDELSSLRGEEVVNALHAADNFNKPLLSWADLNDTEKFREQLDVAYPESYSIMAFLADKYGMGVYARFLKQMSYGYDYQTALEMAYGVSMSTLEAQWKEYLPDFMNTSYSQNILMAYDMSPAIAFYNAGHFSDAKDQFALSKRLYSDLGRDQLSAVAADYLAKAEKALAADDQSHKARQALEAHSYASAKQDAEAAQQAFSELNLDSQRSQAEQTATLAQKGVEATNDLAMSEQHLNTFALPQAQAEAHAAGLAFASLGDTDNVTRANNLLSSLWLRQRIAGAAILALGALCLMLGAFVSIRSLRRRPLRKQPNTIPEENHSWL